MLRKFLHWFILVSGIETNDAGEHHRQYARVNQTHHLQKSPEL